MFKYFIKICKKLFGKEPGFPVIVLAETLGERYFVEGIALESVENKIRINYKGKDNEHHEFYADKNDQNGTHQGLPLFEHTCGYPFCNIPPKQDTTWVSSVTLNYLFDADLATQVLTRITDITKEGFSIPWKKIFIFGVIGILIFYFWSNGTIPGLLEDLMPDLSNNDNQPFSEEKEQKIPTPIKIDNSPETENSIND